MTDHHHTAAETTADLDAQTEAHVDYDHDGHRLAGSAEAPDHGHGGHSLV